MIFIILIVKFKSKKIPVCICESIKNKKNTKNFNDFLKSILVAPVCSNLIVSIYLILKFVLSK